MLKTKSAGDPPKKVRVTNASWYICWYKFSFGIKILVKSIDYHADVMPSTAPNSIPQSFVTVQLTTETTARGESQKHRWQVGMVAKPRAARDRSSADQGNRRARHSRRAKESRIVREARNGEAAPRDNRPGVSICGRDRPGEVDPTGALAGAIASPVVRHRAAIVGPKAYGALSLSTLRSARHGSPRMTRGRCGSLRLHRRGLSPLTSCRSPGAPVHRIIR